MKLLQNINLLSQRLRNENPLVHSITNYVTANDCANAILAVGGSPIMADDKKEVIEIVTIAKALVLNMGTLNERTIESMLVAGKQANKLQIPVILDPVGAGASSFRNDTVKKILEQVSVSVVRGNISEVSYLAAVAAIVYMGIAGEAAWETAGKHGLGSFHIGIFDALSTINTDKLKEMAKIEEL